MIENETADYSISQKEYQVQIAQIKKYYCPIHYGLFANVNSL
jgi:hypothetical protein